MTKFSIETIDEIGPWGPKYPLSRITLGDFTERIPRDKGWTKELCEAQWKKAVSDLVYGRKNRTCLLTDMCHKGKPPPLAWKMYREDDTIYIYNGPIQIFFETPELIENPDRVMPPNHRSIPGYFDENGNCKLSQWVVPLSALAEWLRGKEKNAPGVYPVRQKPLHDYH